MILIQTAIEQEYRAVVSCLGRPSQMHASLSRTNDSTVVTRCGWIGNQFCCVIRTGMGRGRARQVIEEILVTCQRPTLVVSLGLAGALVPKFQIGAIKIISEVRLDAEKPAFIAASVDRLNAAWIQSTGVATLLTVDRPLLTPERKQSAHNRSTAVLCDMETHAIAQVCAEQGLAWAGGRIVSDTAEETLPEWILALPGLVEAGQWRSVLRLLRTHPQDLPGLIRLAYRMRTLKRQLAHFTVEFIRNVVEV